MTIMYFLPFIGLIIGELFLLRRTIHFFQLESYQFQGYFRTLGRQLLAVFLPLLVYCSVAYMWVFARTLLIKNIRISLIFQVISSLFLCLLFASLGLLIAKIYYKRKEKKPFVKTTRIKRLYTAFILLSTVLYFLLFFLFPITISLYGGLLLVLCLPLVLAVSALLALPVEKFIQYLYFKDAEKKIMQNERLVRLGITGSFGKTSTKFILNTLLSQRFNSLATPASFNTPMGLTRIIRERLTHAHQVFIGEMGARHVGEIKELCQLVHPTIGILTSVAPQHLDTFGTIERIEKTKYELIDCLPDDGLAVFLHDDGRVTKLYEKTTKPKILVGKHGSDVYAENIKVTPQGSTFDLHIKGKAPVSVQTKLLGKHNISNILLASAVADHLGMTTIEIARGIGALEAVEHRMQIVSTVGNITVIDDAFNTNPISSKEALHILKSFEGRRIIVTPGMVELGAEEEKYNMEFGVNMANSVDIAVLVGKKHCQPILKGLLQENFKEEQIQVVDSLAEAIAFIKSVQQAGDVILYENDLPDNYL